MPLIEENLWRNPGHPGMIVVTSHASLNEDGSLRMSYEPALEATRRIPGIAHQCGEQIATYAVNDVYGFIPVRPPQPDRRKVGFGIFQTRVRLDEDPDLDLIRHSMDELRSYTVQHADLRVRMNFPGVAEEGLSSRLPPEEVEPLLIPLPDRVVVCHEGELFRSVPTSFPGFKELYIQVERLLREDRQEQAVRFLVSKGFDLQSAQEQVRAVQRLVHGRAGAASRT